MSNNNMMVNNNIYNKAVLSVTKCDNPCDMNYRAKVTGKRLLESAVVLPEGEYIGLRFVSNDGNCDSEIYTSDNVTVTNKDYEWIYDGCGTISAVTDNRNINNTKKRYYLEYIDKYKNDSWDKTQRRQVFDIIRDGVEFFADLFDIIKEYNIDIMINLYSYAEHDVAKGNIIIELDDEISLKLRAIMSQIFLYTRLTEIDDIHEVNNYLSEERLIKGICGVLIYLMRDVPKEEDSDDKYEESWQEAL